MKIGLGHTADSVWKTLDLGTYLSDGVLEFTTPWVKFPEKEGKRTGQEEERKSVLLWRKSPAVV